MDDRRPREFRAVAANRQRFHDSPCPNPDLNGDANLFFEVSTAISGLLAEQDHPVANRAAAVGVEHVEGDRFAAT